jgi:hypothetical protein
MKKNMRDVVSDLNHSDPHHAHLSMAWRMFVDRMERIRAEVQEIVTKKETQSK